MVTKREVEKEFKAIILPAIREDYERDGQPDYSARREAWNNYTDALCKGGHITLRQYETWVHPRCCK